MNYNLREEQLKVLQDLCILDDQLMQKVFKNNIEAVELLLKIIIKRDNLRVVKVKTQYSIKKFGKRSLRLDIYAIDEKDNVINVEVQRKNEGASPKRARYHSSIIDAHNSKMKMEFKDLPETYVIFITENDVLHEGRPIYHIDRFISESQNPFKDDAHIIYVNSKIQDDTELGRLMHDFHCKKSQDIHYSVLAKKVHYYKETEKGVREMLTASEKLWHMGYTEGEIKGETKGKIESVKNLMKNTNWSAREAMNAIGCTLEEQKVLVTYFE